MGSRMPFSTGDHPLTTFSALNLLRNYNQLMVPSGENLIQVYHHYGSGSSVGDITPEDYFQTGQLPIVGGFHPYASYTMPAAPSISNLKSKQSLLHPSLGILGRRPRGEKKPIPEDQKDDRYYERRKRNNEAAKKSRDARKFREDQIALRATLLEHENALLRVQVVTLREEAQALRDYITKEKMIVPGKSLMLVKKAGK